MSFSIHFLPRLVYLQDFIIINKHAAWFQFDMYLVAKSKDRFSQDVVKYYIVFLGAVCKLICRKISIQVVS